MFHLKWLFLCTPECYKGTALPSVRARKKLDKKYIITKLIYGESSTNSTWHNIHNSFCDL